MGRFVERLPICYSNSIIVIYHKVHRPSSFLTPRRTVMHEGVLQELIVEGKI